MSDPHLPFPGGAEFALFFHPESAEKRNVLFVFFSSRYDNLSASHVILEQVAE